MSIETSGCFKLNPDPKPNSFRGNAQRLHGACVSTLVGVRSEEVKAAQHTPHSTLHIHVHTFVYMHAHIHEFAQV